MRTAHLMALLLVDLAVLLPLARAAIRALDR